MFANTLILPGVSSFAEKNALLKSMPVLDAEESYVSTTDSSNTDPLFPRTCTADERCCADDTGLDDFETTQNYDASGIFAETTHMVGILPVLSGLESGPLTQPGQDLNGKPLPTSPRTACLTEVPLATGVELLSPELMNELLKTGQCLLIDVRGADRDAGLIQGAVHVPAISKEARDAFPMRLPELVQRYKNERLIVFFCQFCKHRAPFCANLFREHTDAADNKMQRIAVMEGGFRDWQNAGLPVQDACAASLQGGADVVARREGMLIMTRSMYSASL